MFIIVINETQSDDKPYIINLSRIGGGSNQYDLNSEQDFEVIMQLNGTSSG